MNSDDAPASTPPAVLNHPALDAYAEYLKSIGLSVAYIEYDDLPPGAPSAESPLLLAIFPTTADPLKALRRFGRVLDSNEGQ